MAEVRLMTYEPGHFHAALVQKEMVAGIAPRVHVYASLGSDLLAHLGRIAAFNSRPYEPTRWELEVHTGADPLGRMLAERPGNVVVVSGRNRGKIEVILAALRAGLHVLADKPWIIRCEDLPLLAEALDLADERGLVALDIMTERWEVTTQLQRELLHDPVVFGTIEAGSPDHPGVLLESEHFLVKTVAGVPLRRPVWFFDTEQQGEGLTDVGTHLVDLVPWLLFPDTLVGPDDIEIVRATRTPTPLNRADFQKATGEKHFPAYLADRVASGRLIYHCNNAVAYRLRGIHVWLNIGWGVDAGPAGGDRHLARFRGTRSLIEIRQGLAENYRPEVYIVPHDPADLAGVQTAVRDRLDRLQGRFPGVAVRACGDKLQLTIPEPLRVGHEAHFAEVTRQFLHYLDDRCRLPAREKANMLAKYHLTTRAVRLARE